MSILRKLLRLLCCLVTGLAVSTIILHTVAFGVLDIPEKWFWIASSVLTAILYFFPSVRCCLVVFTGNLFFGKLVGELLTKLLVVLVLRGPVSAILQNVALVARVLLSHAASRLDEKTLLVQTVLQPVSRYFFKLQEENSLIHRAFHALKGEFEGLATRMTESLTGRTPVTSMPEEMSQSVRNLLMEKCHAQRGKWMEDCMGMMDPCMSAFRSSPVGGLGSLVWGWSMMVGNKDITDQKNFVWYAPCQALLNRTCNAAADMCSRLPEGATTFGRSFYSMNEALNGLDESATGRPPIVRLVHLPDGLLDFDILEGLSIPWLLGNLAQVCTALTIALALPGLLRMAFKSVRFVRRYVRDSTYQNMFETPLARDLDKESGEKLFPLRRYEKHVIKRKRHLVRTLLVVTPQNRLLLVRMTLEIIGLAAVIWLEGMSGAVVENLEIFYRTQVSQSSFYYQVWVHGDSALARVLRGILEPLSFQEHLSRTTGLTGPPPVPVGSGIVTKALVFLLVGLRVLQVLPKSIRNCMSISICDFFHPEQARKRAEGLLGTVRQMRARGKDLRKRVLLASWSLIHADGNAGTTDPTDEHPVICGLCTWIRSLWPTKPICHSCFEVEATRQCQCFVPLCDLCFADLDGFCVRCSPEDVEAQALDNPDVVLHI